MGEIIGYVRVSSVGQNLSSQKEAVLGVGATKVFEEKKSGSDTERPRLKECLDYVREGDVLVATRADRIARSMRDLSNILHALDKKGVQVKFTDQPALSTGDKYGRFQLQILGAVAELERELIRERQAAGIKDAKRRGVKFGRKPKVTAKVAKVVKKLRSEGLSVPEIADQVGLKRSSIYNALKL